MSFSGLFQTQGMLFLTMLIGYIFGKKGLADDNEMCIRDSLNALSAFLAAVETGPKTVAILWARSVESWQI